ncbi:hypothetical protein Scep_005788 [Stephania cephalantha]|uniref:Uncharacterized protein n=1 Tax=Stephania cephalantha TaxID=152367 RepID=A0AAP0KWQ9_9MAGN
METKRVVIIQVKLHPHLQCTTNKRHTQSINNAQPATTPTKQLKQQLIKAILQ